MEQGERRCQVEDAGSGLGGLDCHLIPATDLGKALGPPGPVFPLKQEALPCLAASQVVKKQC